MQRSAMRELAFKLVYEIEVQKENEDEQIEIFIENNEIFIYYISSNISFASFCIFKISCFSDFSSISCDNS